MPAARHHRCLAEARQDHSVAIFAEVRIAAAGECNGSDCRAWKRFAEKLEALLSQTHCEYREPGSVFSRTCEAIHVFLANWVRDKDENVGDRSSGVPSV